MLTTKCIHPGLMKALSLCGHGSKVLIADGNYPLAEKSGNAEKIYLGLTPGLPTVTQVLEAIHSVVEIEKAEVMFPGDGSRPEIFDEFEKELAFLWRASAASNITTCAVSPTWCWPSPPARSGCFPTSC